jgi:hypothetical protein
MSKPRVHISSLWNHNIKSYNTSFESMAEWVFWGRSQWPAARSKAWTVFAISNTGVVVLNPTRGTNVCVRLFCVCVVLYVGGGLATGWSPIQGALLTLYGLRNWKAAKVHKGCRAIDRVIFGPMTNNYKKERICNSCSYQLVYDIWHSVLLSFWTLSFDSKLERIVSEPGSVPVLRLLVGVATVLGETKRSSPETGVNFFQTDRSTPKLWSIVFYSHDRQSELN